MASLEERLIALAQGIGADVKALRLADGDLSALSTTAKGSLVAAINELQAAIAGAGVAIDDLAGDGDGDVTWSADKIHDAIAAACSALKSELTDGASAALDTFKEFQTALGNDPSFAATMATALANRVRFDDVQVLTAAQKAQACANIGIGDPDTDLVAVYTTAKA